MKRVLIATLGESPAVVTEAIDKLKSEGIHINYVVLITTEDSYAIDSVELLCNHIPQYYRGNIYVGDVRTIETFYDVDSDESALEFMRQACLLLRDYRKMSKDVYVCIAGGRKAMSALMTLAVQFYGATMLFHVIVDDPEIEEMGHISNLQNLSNEEVNQYLHPPVGKIKIIRLPFIGLFPLLGEIISCLKGKSTRPEIKTILEQNGLIKKNKPTELGRTVLQILEDVETLPEPRKGECEIKLPTKEPKEYEETERWTQRIRDRFPFVERIEAIGWREGQPKVKEEPPNKLILFVPGKRVKGIGFRLITTAKTKGQLQRAKQEVEHWLKKDLKL